MLRGLKDIACFGGIYIAYYNIYIYITFCCISISLFQGTLLRVDLNGHQKQHPSIFGPHVDTCPHRAINIGWGVSNNIYWAYTLRFARSSQYFRLEPSGLCTLASQFRRSISWYKPCRWDSTARGTSAYNPHFGWSHLHGHGHKENSTIYFDLGRNIPNPPI